MSFHYIKFLTIAAAVACTSTAAAQPSADQLAQMKYEVYNYSTEVFANPERGLFKHIDFTASSTNTLSPSALASYRNEGISLLYTGYILDTYRNGGSISQSFLNRIGINMQRLRDAGMKCVCRFYYSYDSSMTPWDTPLETTLKHIEQLKPVLQEYADVIAVLEAGFVGLWGEWAYTQNHVSNPQTYTDYENRRQIVKALADALPQTRFVSLRTPMAVMGVLDITPTDTITSETAYNGSLRSRLGFHNDCFLANADDAGTYHNVGANRTFTRSDSRYTPMGGETCSAPNSYTSPYYARRNFKDYHWSYLNNDYHQDCIADWRNSGFLDEIRTSLGYRFALTEAWFTPEPVSGERFDAVLSIENKGWAAPYNPRDVEIVFVDRTDPLNVQPFSLEIDPRRWAPGTVTTINVSLYLPGCMAEGTYDVYLNLPDPEPTLHENPAFSIRCANELVWNSLLGMNRLTTLKVVSQAGIHDAVNPASDADPAAPVFDINGRRVGSVSDISTLSEGIYIVNGQKIKL